MAEVQLSSNALSRQQSENAREKRVSPAAPHQLHTLWPARMTTVSPTARRLTIMSQSVMELSELCVSMYQALAA
eukprot:scaffold77206_cov37-Prasinocladus_malaysianus.AAC.2